MLNMRNKSTLLILTSFVVWSIVSYFFIFYQHPMKKNKVGLSMQINELENEVSNLLSTNMKMIEDYEILNKKDLVPDEKYTNVSIKGDSFNERNQNLKKKNGKFELNSEDFKFDLRHNDLKVQQILSNSPSKILHSNVASPVIAVLVISCNRITVQRCLDQLIKFRPSVEQFPIIVSQDCDHQETLNVIKKYGTKIIHIQQPDQSEIEIPLRERKFSGYFKIARHYGWALNQTFFKFNFETAIIVEDDLDISRDFFEYFLGTYPLLKSDPSLWCISAWNDNGKLNLIDQANPHLLYRTDFFPGLGWMLTRNLWFELSSKWPKSYWDDWIRQPDQRKNRACIRPEISRTRTFGKIGVSNGLFFEKHLQYIKLNNETVPFTKMNLTYLLKENYDLMFVKEVYKSKIITFSELKSNQSLNRKTVRIPYYTRQSYKNIAKIVGLMDDFKSGIPRTGYRGIVTFYYNNQRVYLAPSASWSGYDLSWS